jgi:16S rRNA (cytosine1402-N4)-methyltransferase
MHISVLLEPILEYIKPQDKVFDGTFGGGGYTKAFLQKNCICWASDLDETAIDRFDNSQNLVTFFNASFDEAIQTFEDNFLDVAVVDLGYSSNQLDFSERGFSYQKLDETLDLRYNQNQNIPCFEKIRKLKNVEDLSKILYNYSGEEFSSRIAKALWGKNHTTVGEFVETIISIIPAKFQKKKNSILSRVWQSLRIWTNSEFEALENFLQISVTKIKVGGLLMVVDFHSLEDKIVTKFMRNLAKPVDIDDFGNKQKKYEFITPKGILPTTLEIENNIRSRSATLRILRKLV